MPHETGIKRKHKKQSLEGRNLVLDSIPRARRLEFSSKEQETSQESRLSSAKPADSLCSPLPLQLGSGTTHFSAKITSMRSSFQKSLTFLHV